MLDYIESFFTRYDHTFSALAALGTWAAVIVTLSLGRKVYSYDVKGRAYISSKFITDESSKEEREVFIPKEDRVVLSIQNRGRIPLVLSDISFFLTIPFISDGAFLQASLDHFPEPCVIAPNTSERIEFLEVSEINRLRNELEAFVNASHFMARCLKKYLRFTAIASDGVRLHFKIEKNLKNRLISKTSL